LLIGGARRHFSSRATARHFGGSTFFAPQNVPFFWRRPGPAPLIRSPSSEHPLVDVDARSILPPTRLEGDARRLRRESPFSVNAIARVPYYRRSASAVIKQARQRPPQWTFLVALNAVGTTPPLDTLNAGRRTFSLFITLIKLLKNLMPNITGPILNWNTVR
jgi:hypothetical protein